MTGIDVMFAGVPVADLDGAVAWYTRLLGRPADIVPNDNEVMWRLADKAWMYVVRDGARAGHSLVMFSVPDIDAAVEDVGGRGITGGPIEVVGGAGRKVSFPDPDGNLVSFIEVLASGG